MSIYFLILEFPFNIHRPSVHNILVAARPQGAIDSKKIDLFRLHLAQFEGKLLQLDCACILCAGTGCPVWDAAISSLCASQQIPHQREQHLGHQGQRKVGKAPHKSKANHPSCSRILGASGCPCLFGFFPCCRHITGGLCSTISGVQDAWPELVPLDDR